MLRTLLCLLLPAAVLSSGPEVRLPSGGRLRGTYQTTLGGRRLAAFLGVPFAKPPQRFKIPEPAEPWEGVLETVKEKADCMQYSELTLAVHGSEDCLYANVYISPDFLGSTELRDVVIYIHGGGFSYMIAHYGPRYIMDHDVVFVTFTYRVGPLGFLSTGDRVLPGNLGLKDQNMLLRWVQENIRAFGGNPNRVLLSGTSAGGASVHYHMLSPLSKGLFHRAFSMSGCALCPWTQTENAKDRAKSLAQNLGCPTETSEELVECLSGKEAVDIVGQMKEQQKWLYFPFTPFGPVVEPDSETAFISKYPSEVIRDGEAMDIPWLTTLVSEEGLYPAADFVANETYLNLLDEKWNEWLPSLLDYEHTTTIIPKDRISQRIKEKYIGQSSVKDNIPGVIGMCSDRLFVDCVVRGAKLHAAHYRSPVFSYVFSYRGKHSSSETVCKSQTNFGVSHGDDTAYMFQNELMNAEDSKEDRKMIELLTQIVVSFAKTGRPTIKGLKRWPTICNDNDFTFVHIKDTNKFDVVSSSSLGQSAFWSSFKLSED